MLRRRIAVTLFHQLEGLDKKYGARYSPLTDKGSYFIPNLFRHSEGNVDPGPVAYRFTTGAGTVAAPAVFLFFSVIGYSFYIIILQIHTVRQP